MLSYMSMKAAEVGRLDKLAERCLFESSSEVS